MRYAASAALLVGLAPAALVPPAQAAFPGANGVIAVHTNRDGNNEIYIITSDGGDAARLTSNSASDTDPAWSPDGTKIAFVSNRDGNNEIYTMNSDGTAQTRVTNNPAYDADPAWSADGTQIAFASDRDGDFEIYRMTASGSSVTRLTTNATYDGFPAWSPDGSKIAFVSARDGNNEIYTMNADGTNQVNRTNNAADDAGPSWSPDGSRIAFSTTRAGEVDVYKMNADGSSLADLTNSDNLPDRSPAWSPDGTLIAESATIHSFSHDGLATFAASGGGLTAVDVTSLWDDDTPDWQPIVRSYARPKGASPVRVALVPAYKQCTGSSASHNGALARPSCYAPTPESGYLTVGTPDYNGEGANSVGSVLLKAFCNGGTVGEVPPCSTTAGDQEDMSIAVSDTDVRCVGASGGCASGLSDYGGQLRFDTTFRVTDKNNGPFTTGLSVNGTVTDLPLRFSVPCTTTTSTSTGSTCAATTSVDAVIGGATAISEQKRAIWQLSGDVKLYDGGTDGVGSTAADNTLFATGGVFLP